VETGSRLAERDSGQSVVNTERCRHDNAQYSNKPEPLEAQALDVGERLQSIRKLKGLSQRELAKRAGVTNSTISMIEKNSVSPSISSLRKVLGGIPMSMVEFFSEEILQEKPTQIVYKANELIDISDGAVTMKLVGRAHPSRAIAFLNEIYPPGADTGDEMLTP
jgi:transcriptional regulator with XRE-family HTH domain